MSDLPVSFQKIRHGDITEFEYLFRTWYERLCLYSVRLVKDDSSAEEIVSQVLIKLWEQRKELNINTSLESYLFASVRNSSVNYLKRIQVQEKYKAMVQYQLKYIDLLYPNDPLSKLISDEIIEKIEKAIEALPPQCREVLHLNRFEGLSYNEVAEKLNISINTVHN